MSPEKKTWRKWIVKTETWVHEVEAYTQDEARAKFDANESACVDSWFKTEQSDVTEIGRNP